MKSSITILHDYLSCSHQVYMKLLLQQTLPGMQNNFILLQEKVGAFIHVGMKSEKSQYPHHHPKFDIDEAAIPAAIELMIQLALNV